MNCRNTVIMTAFAAFLLVLSALPALADKGSVGFVNPQRIINESTVGRMAQEDLARLGRLKDKRIRASADKINKMKEDLAKELLSVGEQQARQEDIRLAFKVHEDLVQRSNLEIQFEEQRLIQFIMKKADMILRRLAERNGFMMVLTDPEAIGYINSSIDLTDDVIRELNAML